MCYYAVFDIYFVHWRNHEHRTEKPQAISRTDWLCDAHHSAQMSPMSCWKSACQLLLYCLLIVYCAVSRWEIDARSLNTVASPPQRPLTAGCEKDVLVSTGSWGATHVQRYSFTARRYAPARPVPSCGVCLSVCPSVTFVYCIISSDFSRIATPFYFSLQNLTAIFQQGPFNGGVECRGMKKSRFSEIALYRKWYKIGP